MPEKESQTLSGVAETSLIALYIRAMESQRPDALIKDENAVALVKRLNNDFDRIRQIPLSEANKLAIILRNREFDRYVRDFLARQPESVVVQIGCGLDARFERVDNGLVEWYDLDLPDVIELRRKLIGGERERYHLLGHSVLEDAWIEAVGMPCPLPYLFLAEGVSMYFAGAQVRSLVLTLCDHFPSAELVFDAYSPSHIWIHRLLMPTSQGYPPVRWGIWHGEAIEKWGDGIHLLDEWGYTDRPEPRLAQYRWLRPIDLLFRTLRIYHFQLGKMSECKV